MELLSCRTRPRHPFHAAYSHRKVNTFLLLLACPTFPATSALLANWFRFAGKKEGERNGKEGEGEDFIPKNTEANKSISYIFFYFLLPFSPCCLSSWSNMVAERGRYERQKWRREGKWLVRVRLLPGEHIDIWELVNGDEWLKWCGGPGQVTPGGFLTSNPTSAGCLCSKARRHTGASEQKYNFRLW